jgi:hypothetical protein
LVKARQRVPDLKEKLADAEKNDKRALARAIKHGWSAEELKKYGLENAAAGRRESTTRRARQDAGQPNTDGSEENES